MDFFFFAISRRFSHVLQKNSPENDYFASLNLILSIYVKKSARRRIILPCFRSNFSFFLEKLFGERLFCYFSEQIFIIPRKIAPPKKILRHFQFNFLDSRRKISLGKAILVFFRTIFPFFLAKTRLEKNVLAIYQRDNNWVS